MSSGPTAGWIRFAGITPAFRTRNQLQFQKLRPDAVRVGVQDGDAAPQIEARLAGVTGIEIKRAANRLAKRLVRVAEDNHVRSLANNAALEGLRRFARVNDVMHEEFAAVEFGYFRFLEIDSGVVVAEHGGHRRDLFQFQNQPGQSDVAAVQNMVHTREELRNLRIKVSVRVGKDADFQAFDSSVCAPSGWFSGSSSAASASSSSAFSPSFIAPTNRPVNRPVLSSVFQKNIQVGG